MPTLLAVNNYHYPRGGAEVVFLEQNRLFAEHGWQVAPFCMQHPDNLPSEWSRFFVDEIEFGSEYSLIEKVRRVPKVIYSREAQAKLSAMLDELKPDVAQLHNIYHHISPAILPVLKRRGVPTVMTLHDLKLGCPAYKMLAHDGVCERCKGGRLHNVVRHRCVKDSLALSAVVFMESQLHQWLGTYDKCVDRFVVPSAFFASKLAEFGVDAERMVQIPNFVHAEAFEPATAAGSYFLYFGRLAPEKGLVTLIRAAAQARVPLKVVGTGPEQAALEALAGELEHPVEFAGYQTGAALHRYIRDARAVVLPSEWYENAPVSVLEAYALGVPVVGADIGGIPEMIRAGETGSVVPSADVDALAAELARLTAASDADVHELGRTGRAWVQESYSAELHFERLRALFNDLGV